MNRFILLLLPLLFSFTFSPMSQTIDLGEKQKATQYLIENDSDQKMAIELSVKERAMNEKGEETLTATTEMAIFPPQIIIQPGDKRTIRVSWTGKDIPTAEKNFRVIAEQLDLKVDAKSKNKSGVKMLMKYMATLYLTPEDAEEKLSITSFEKKGNEVSITIENSGNRHKILADPKITFANDNKKVLLEKNDLIGIAGENVLGNSKRIFVIKTTKEIPAKSKATLKVND
ncbi:fimbrial biogenesis chaperone [Peredibacter starrii]|uniref:Fimbria/pilus periplasmic chaperone n=1 Tax=Peredibacter starrii TaxID=28202 RepID=A0AAX4HL32_9BACT|nr:fimbria/pilus periplasmic chaperone [Peredibacter starrii]WPU63916.1 fimbria/pilus periplasmic chaperone [Peredibacter starrii]